MKEKYEQFEANVMGQKVEMSSSQYPYQCMDLAYAWIFSLGYPKATIQNLYAYQVYTNASELTKKYFDPIPNTPNAIPQVGDLVIWNSNVGGGAGHIAIATGSGGLSQFTSLDQNWPTGSAVARRNHDYSNVLGWLRPRYTASSEMTAQTVIPAELLPKWGKAEEIQQLDGFAYDLQIVVQDRENLRQELVHCTNSKQQLADILAECQAKEPEVIEKTVIKYVDTPYEGAVARFFIELAKVFNTHKA